MASLASSEIAGVPDEQQGGDSSCRAIRSSFLPQNGDSSLEISDIWHNVAHEDFDKSNDNSRTRAYSVVRDNTTLLPAPTSDGSIQDVANPAAVLIAGSSDVADGNHRHASCQDTCAVDDEGNESNAGVKRARRDEQIKESLSQMVKTWRESLEVLKDSEAKRVETLQRLSSTMTGLLEILKK